MKATVRLSHGLSKLNRKQPEQEPQNTEAGESHTYKGKKNVRRKTRIQEWGKVNKKNK